jgi:hypothetical protein
VNALAHNFVQRVGGVDQAIDSSAGLRILGLEEGLPRLPDLEFAIYEKARPERRQPELLARHCTEAGLIEKAADFWGKAGQRLRVRRWWRPWSRSRRLLTRSRHCPPRPRCDESRSGFRSPS